MVGITTLSLIHKLSFLRKTTAMWKGVNFFGKTALAIHAVNADACTDINDFMFSYYSLIGMSHVI